MNATTRTVVFILFLTQLFVLANAWCSHSVAPRFHQSSISLLKASAASSSIEFQKDHGRGEDHLSAFLQEGDVIVYQTGSWLVDGVEVGDGGPPSFAWAKIDNLQVVWSHNCEHGVLRGIALLAVTAAPPPQQQTVRICETNPMEFIEFGPEQLVARVIPEWDDEDESCGKTAVPIVDCDSSSFWMVETGQTWQ